MNKILLFIFTIILTYSSQNTAAQIFASGNTAETITSYPSFGTNHPIYLYKELTVGTLTATTTTPGTNFNYTWYYYDSGSWTQITSGNINTLNNIDEKGYRVEINIDGSVTENYYCWVFKPELISSSIEEIDHTCSNLNLNAKSEVKALNYYDLSTGTIVPLNYHYTYQWTSIPDGDISTINTAMAYIEAPYENSTYNVTIKAFGETILSNVELEVVAKAVKADFEMSPTDREFENEIQELTLENFKGSAPVNMSFKNTSLGNITDYEYNFTKQADGENEEYTYAPRLESNTNFTFTDRGKYLISLTVSNVLTGCSDTENKGPIDVIEMKIEAPNVFTPDGDGINDKFFVVYKSVAEFKMTIVNRWGRKVFSTTNPGDAWDGKIGGKKAAEGVYFYYIYAKGYNKGEEDKLEGPLHLIRGK